MLVPKAAELVATPYRFDGDKEKAKRFFEEGLKTAFSHMRKASHPDYPMTVYYAFKQTESRRTIRESGEDDRFDGLGDDVRGINSIRLCHHRYMADADGIG